MFRRKPTIIVVCCILLILVLLNQTDPPWSDSEQTDHTAHKHQLHAQNEQLDITNARPAKRVSVSYHQKANATHTHQQLENFIIPQLQLNNTSFAQALHQLRNEYYIICQKTGETPISIKFEIQNSDSNTITLNLRNISFTRALNTLSAIAGMDMTREKNTMIFSPMKKHGDLFTRTFVVPPDLVSRLTNSSQVDADPFTSGTDHASSPIPPKVAFDQRLRTLFNLPDTSDLFVKYIPATSTIVTRADLSELDRLATFFDTCAMHGTSYLRVSSKVVTMQHGEANESFPSLMAPTAMTATDLRQFMRHIATMTGTDIMTLPSVLAKPGETATVNVTNEVSLASTTAPQKPVNDWTGMKLHILAENMGFGSMTHPNLLIQELPPDANTVSRYRSGQQTFVSDGNTVCYPINHPDYGRAYLLVTHQRVDATGK